MLNDERASLYRNIDLRVDQMIDQGLLDEVRRLKKSGCTSDMVAMQGLGYKEMLAYLDGEYDFEEAVRVLKRDTRHFAKRQLTWFRREREVIWINKGEFGYDPEKMLDYMTDLLKKKGISDGTVI